MKPEGYYKKYFTGGKIMKTMTSKEILLLGKDLNMAKMRVLQKHGFTCEEIATVMGLKESMVRRLIESVDESNNAVNGEESC